MATTNNSARVKVLEKLLAGLLDGVDGYESETGGLRPFWLQENVDAARDYLKALPDRGAAAGYWLARLSAADR
jgi:hypothetical protein